MRVSGVRPPVRHRPASAPLTCRMRGIASLCVGDHDPARVWGVTRVVRTRSSVFRSVHEPFGDVHEPFGDVRERERTLAEPPFFRRPGTPRYPLGVRRWPPSRHRWVLLPKMRQGWAQYVINPRRPGSRCSRTVRIRSRCSRTVRWRSRTRANA